VVLSCFCYQFIIIAKVQLIATTRIYGQGLLLHVQVVKAYLIHEAGILLFWHLYLFFTAIKRRAELGVVYNHHIFVMKETQYIFKKPCVLFGPFRGE